MTERIIDSSSERMVELMKKTPVLNNPDGLTISIMEAIESTPQVSEKAESNSRILMIVTRTLAIASVLLFMIFGIEQAIVLQKVGDLEQLTGVRSSYATVATENLVMLNIGLTPTILTSLSGDNYIRTKDKKLSNKIRSARIVAIANNLNHRQKIETLLFQHIK